MATATPDKAQSNKNQTAKLAKAKELKTDIPLSEKDEVKRAEDRISQATRKKS